MRYLDEYRSPQRARRLIDEIRAATSGPHVLMEICGGQTHAIVRYGIDQLLPAELSLVHGPGCPVCVTPVELVDKAIEIASRPEVIFCSFGDMLRVPGHEQDLLMVKAAGGDVRIVYSPLDAVRLARENPQRQVVFFAVGFETTAPGNAMAVYQAHQQGIENFSLLVSHVLVPPAMRAILASPENRVQGFLAAGHVCAVMGVREYEPIAAEFRVPIVVTGFEPVDILQGILLCVRQLEQGRCEVENPYGRAVRPEGNLAAQDIMRQVFAVGPRKWRGIGEIPQSGLILRGPYTRYDAEQRFGVADYERAEDPACESGLILQGIKRPADCPAFASRCTPHHPLGATMVSSEGACAAYYQYRRRSSRDAG